MCCHGAARIFLTAPRFYEVVALHRGACEKRLRDGKLATSSNGEDEGEDELDERLGVAKELRVGGLIVEIDGNGAVVTWCFGGLCHVSSPRGWRLMRMRHGEGNVLKWQAYCEPLRAPPRNSGESEISHTRTLVGCSSGPLEVLARRVHHTRSTSWQRREARQWLVPLPEEVSAPPSLPRSMPHTPPIHYATEWHRRPQQATPHCGDGREGGGSWVSHRVERGVSHVPQALPTLSSHRSAVRQIERFAGPFL